MNISGKTILASSVKLSFLPMIVCISYDSAYASLTNLTQNQTFESKPQVTIISKQSTSSFTKLASVYFITGNDGLVFDGQEFKTDDLCVTAGYTFKGCPANYIAVDPCPDDGSYYKNCIDKSTWCQNNGYNITSCQLPQYPATPCPYDASYYKTCETDNIKACKELGYSLTCETGKVGDTNNICPYNSSYKKCVCNPCSGYNYTASEATEQGYIMGESCNSCGTLKYKRTENACSGYTTCECGGENGAGVCYSGSTKKFSACKSCCNSSSSNWCSVHSTCHGDCCSDGSIEPCDERCGGSGCSSSDSGGSSCRMGEGNAYASCGCTSHPRIDNYYLAYSSTYYACDDGNTETITVEWLATPYLDNCQERVSELEADGYCRDYRFSGHPCDSVCD